MPLIEPIRLSSGPDSDQRHVYVYLVDRCCLVNSGAAETREQLQRELVERDVSVNQIKRVVYTDWTADAFGNQDLFVKAHHFHVGLAEEITTFVDAESKRLNTLATAIGATLPETMFKPPMDGITINDGIRVAIGNTVFETVLTPGVTAGSATFHHPEHTFIGAIPTFGFPDATLDAESYMTSLDRLRALPLAKVHPLHAEAQTRGDWIVKRVQETTQMLLSTVGTKVEPGDDMVMCIERAFGIEIDSVDTLFHQIRRYGPFIEPFMQTQSQQTD